MSNSTQAKSFTLAVKERLLHEGMTVTALAIDIDFARNTVSRTINHPTIHPQVRAKIAKRLRLKS